MFKPLRKRRIVFFVFFILLLSYLLYVAYERKKRSDWAKDLDINPIFYVNEEDAYEWELFYDGKRIVVRKEGKEAYMVFPEKLKIDYSVYLANVKNFNSIGYYSIVEEGDQHLKKWGINQSKNYYVLRYKDKGEERSKTIYRGNKLPFAEGYYIYSKEDKRVYAAKFWVIASLEKTVPELRERNVFNVRPDKIMEYGFEDVHIRKKGVFWVVDGLKPEEISLLHADMSIQTIAYLRAEKVYLSGEKSMDFSTTNATSWFIYEDGGKKIRKELSFLKKDMDGVYLRVRGDDAIYEIQTHQYEQLVRPLSYYTKSSEDEESDGFPSSTTDKK